MTMQAKASGQAESGQAAIIAAAIAITILDGFDAFSLSLVAPRLSADLGIPTAALGGVFASAMGGMIVGAFVGGALADKLGRLRVLMAALLLFGLAALTMPLVASAGQIIANRLVAGMGLGAAAPIAVALLSRASVKPPTEMVISAVWAGIAVGGILAATFNYFVVAAHGWHWIFIAGGVLPAPAALFAYVVFRGRENAADGRQARRPRLSELFVDGRAGRTAATALMFFFGYVTTSMIVNWLPTILHHRAASPLMISSVFGGINIGGVLGILALGALATRLRSRWTLAAVWAAAGVCGLCAASPALGNTPVALLAIAAATLASGAQALSVAFANALHRAQGLESTSVGFMTSMGRVGQFTALSSSGLILGLGVSETGLFALAAACAFAAAVIALVVMQVGGGRGALPSS
jgi:AAHS family 3-hydroxyphenylpropionic acid transporter